jgi:hypothetical protein
MFRGGDYVDDPNFNDFIARPGYNYMDVTDINGEDKFGRSYDSPNHKRNRINLAATTGEQIIGSPTNRVRIQSIPAAGLRRMPDVGKRFVKEVIH